MSLSQYPNYQYFLHQCILAVDYGVKRVGLARFCPGEEPFPLPQECLKMSPHFFTDFGLIVKRENAQVLVLGLPTFFNGEASDMTKKVYQFALELKKEFPAIPLFLQDETLSSLEAENRMKESPRYGFKVDKKSLDSLSAAIILEDFIRNPKRQMVTI